MATLLAVLVALEPTFARIATRARRSRALRRKLLKALFRIRTLIQYMPPWESAVQEATTQLDLTLADQELLEEVEIDRIGIVYDHLRSIQILKEVRNPKALMEQLEAAFVELAPRAPRLEEEASAESPPPPPSTAPQSPQPPTDDPQRPPPSPE